MGSGKIKTGFRPSLEDMINLIVKNKITIQNLPKGYHQAIKDALTLSNPKFFILQRMHKYVGNISDRFEYFKELENGDLVVPRGCLSRVKKFISTKVGKSYNIENKTIEINIDLLKKKIELRDYQTKLIDELMVTTIDRNEGIISMTTGTGKTIVALETIRRLGLTATIIVPKTDILNQFYNEAKDKFGYQIGRIGGGHRTIKPITVVTFQSLQHDKKLLKDLAAQTSILFVDECQDVPAARRAQVVSKFRPKYLLGLSGTPARTDGRTKAIFFYMGKVIARYKKELLKPKVEVVYTQINTPTHKKVIVTDKRGREKEIKKRLEYHEVIEKMIDNKSRNNLVAGLTVGEVSQGRRVLVLTKRVAHYQKFKKRLTFDGVHFIDSKDKGREALLFALKEFGGFKVIFGTTSLLSVGTDIPALDTLIIACDLKSSVLTTQSVGRILRIFKDKKDPRIIDLCDNRNPMLYRQYKAREALYIAKGWHVKTPWEDFNKPESK